MLSPSRTASASRSATAHRAGETLSRAPGERDGKSAQDDRIVTEGGDHEPAGRHAQ